MTAYINVYEAVFFKKLVPNTEALLSHIDKRIFDN